MLNPTRIQLAIHDNFAKALELKNEKMFVLNSGQAISEDLDQVSTKRFYSPSSRNSFLCNVSESW
jgi:hypothetical protein